MRCAIEASCFDSETQAIRITVSAGVSARRPEDKSFKDVLRRADKALFKAKSLAATGLSQPEGRAITVLPLGHYRHCLDFQT